MPGLQRVPGARPGAAGPCRAPSWDHHSLPCAWGHPSIGVIPLPPPRADPMSAAAPWAPFLRWDLLCTHQERGAGLGKRVLQGHTRGTPWGPSSEPLSLGSPLTTGSPGVAAHGCGYVCPGCPVLCQVG